MYHIQMGIVSRRHVHLVQLTTTHYSYRLDSDGRPSASVLFSSSDLVLETEQRTGSNVSHVFVYGVRRTLPSVPTWVSFPRYGVHVNRERGTKYGVRGADNRVSLPVLTQHGAGIICSEYIWHPEGSVISNGARPASRLYVFLDRGRIRMYVRST